MVTNVVLHNFNITYVDSMSPPSSSFDPVRTGPTAGPPSSTDADAGVQRGAPVDRGLVTTYQRKQKPGAPNTLLFGLREKEENLLPQSFPSSPSSRLHLLLPSQVFASTRGYFYEKHVELIEKAKGLLLFFFPPTSTSFALYDLHVVGVKVMDDQMNKEESLVVYALKNCETICWGCGLRLVLSSDFPIFKCGWCGAITNHNQKSRKPDSVCFSRWRCLRDRLFIAVVFLFMLFAIFFNCFLKVSSFFPIITGAGVWAVYPIVFSVSYFCGIFHSSITAILAICTMSSFFLASSRSAGAPPNIIWGSHPAVQKGNLEDYTFCTYCAKPKSPRAHHCRSCRMCVLDMDHHCPFVSLTILGLLLMYLTIAGLSIEIGISVLLWQQLRFIYEGKTYLNHLISQKEGGLETKGCQNILRFFGCPQWAYRILPVSSHAGKLQETSSSKLFMPTNSVLDGS
ncbi:hypothetical protein Taro_037159 [Colocasia esculenta]|uniref:S-acyltransferase n=1 Tax=Colocasia esculenta TaxID=4460 RepID=A0A843W8X8_COLES|nr:hypothetical protein [Colocasia esculenta]